jgi:hypothetical protein
MSSDDTRQVPPPYCGPVTPEHRRVLHLVAIGELDVGEAPSTFLDLIDLRLVQMASACNGEGVVRWPALTMAGARVLAPDAFAALAPAREWVIACARKDAAERNLPCGGEEDAGESAEYEAAHLAAMHAEVAALLAIRDFLRAGRNDHLRALRSLVIGDDKPWHCTALFLRDLVAPGFVRQTWSENDHGYSITLSGAYALNYPRPAPATLSAWVDAELAYFRLCGYDAPEAELEAARQTVRLAKTAALDELRAVLENT